MSHFLITGHTGFKGSWLTLLLRARGHQVSGIALDPLERSLFNEGNVSDELLHDLRVDVRDRPALIEAFEEVSPDLVIHLAAQALVGEGFGKPLETYETNVLGTLNVLYAVDNTDSVEAQLVVTTDKVYRSKGTRRPYIEEDSLGGDDPYSASKAMADILAQQWLARPDAKPGAVARAGNVIGAGDHSANRLIPDIHRAVRAGTSLEIRFPEAVRPWQHVLDCLNGYLILLQNVHENGLAGAWNVGPTVGQVFSVEKVVTLANTILGDQAPLASTVMNQFEEDSFLAIDSSKIRAGVGWSDRLALKASLEWSLAELLHSAPIADLVRNQVRLFEEM